MNYYFSRQFAKRTQQVQQAHDRLVFSRLGMPPRWFGAIFLLAGIASVAAGFSDVLGSVHAEGSIWVPFVVGGLFALVGYGITFYRSRLEFDFTRRRWRQEHGVPPWSKVREGALSDWNHVQFERQTHTSSSEGGTTTYLVWALQLRAADDHFPPLVLTGFDFPCQYIGRAEALGLAATLAQKLNLPLHEADAEDFTRISPAPATPQRSRRTVLVTRLALPLLLGITLLNSYGGGLTLVRHWRDGSGRRFVSSNSLWKTHTICVDAQGQVTEAQAAYTPFGSSTSTTGSLPEEEGDTSNSRWSLLLGANAEKALGQARQDAVAYALTPRHLSGSESGIRRFQYYNNDDSPKGQRYWTQLSPMEWQERYDTGMTTKFRVEQRTQVEGDAGITAQKQDGTSLRVFIPDRGSRKMRLRFRYDGQPDWTDLGEMTHVE